MHSPASRFAFLPGLVALAVSLGTPLHAQRMELADASVSAVVVESADIKTEVTGRIAVTTYDLIFRNPNNRVLEGTFVLPLLDGQSVVRFGLDINGALREAVPVDKVQGRIVFEEIERRRVDPGLLEQTQGNNYRARVFPIPAHGTRRILIAYQEDVLRGTGAATYRLNLDFPGRLKNFRLAIAAFTSDGEAATVRTTLGLKLPAWRNRQFMEIERSDFEAKGLLELSLPKGDHPRVITGRRGEENYFYAEAPVALAPQARPAPKVVGLLWDSSGSGRQRDRAREFALLDAWFTRLGDVDVRLVRLRDEAEPAQAFTVRKGNWKALRRELERTAYDGATSLDGLKDDPAVDEWVLFSDGLVNFGVTPASAKLKLRGAVHTVLASASADPAWLRGVAARQQGEFVNLLELDAGPAAARLRTRGARVLKVEFDTAEVSQVFPERGAPLPAGPLVVTGIFRQERAIVKLRVGSSEDDAHTIEVVARAGENPSTLAARGWAVAKIDHLSLDRATNRADIRRTSRDFGLVTADTSLIVLETIDDYVRYDIEPPAELRDQWLARRRPAVASGTPSKNQDWHLENVVRSFNERMTWWETKFPKDAIPAHWQYSYKAQPMAPARREEGLSSTASRPLGAPAVAAPRAPIPTGSGDTREIVMLEAFEVSGEHSGSATALSQSRLSSAVMTTGGALFRAGSADAASSASARAKADRSPPSPSEAIITLASWSPDAGYLDRLNRADDDDLYEVYLQERPDHEREPGFFLDVADFFFSREQPALGRRIVSNLAELQLEDVALLRALAHRLVQAERPDLALPLFERVLALRPDEPQSRRDLALACADVKQFQRAVDLLWEIVCQSWSNRFPQFELIALSELNAIAATCGEELDLSRVDPRLRQNLPVQARIVLTWDTNDCDIDLWVTDPNAETAIYNHARTYQGGLMSSDFTGGYGPEEFLLRDPKPGKYRAKINYYGDGRQSALGPVTAQVRLITGFGTSAQKEQRVTVRLESRKETLDVGTLAIAAPSKKTKPATGEQ